MVALTSHPGHRLTPGTVDDLRHHDDRVDLEHGRARNPAAACRRQQRQMTPYGRTVNLSRKLLKAAVDNRDMCRGATYVSDPVYAGVTVQTLVDIDAAASDDDKLTHLV